MSPSKQNKIPPKIKATRDYYNTYAREWSSEKTDSFYHEKFFTLLTTLLKPKSHVLDIGCAGAIHVPLFLGIGRKLRYMGLDISKSFLSIARLRYPHLTFAEGNIADRSTLPKKKFDGFMAMAILMHVPYENWDEMFSNIEHLMKPGAYGCLSIPTMHASGSLGKKDTDVRQFTIVEQPAFLHYLKKRGWKIIRKEPYINSRTKVTWWSYIVQIP